MTPFADDALESQHEALCAVLSHIDVHCALQVAFAVGDAYGYDESVRLIKRMAEDRDDLEVIPEDDFYRVFRGGHVIFRARDTIWDKV